jgi:acyl-CoA dehydrogenase
VTILSGVPGPADVPTAELMADPAIAAAAPTLQDRAAVAAAVAALHADDVDSVGRFPVEALQALREQRLLGALIGVEDGGDGATLAEVAEVVTTLAQHCASTAMIYAMHQIQVACLVRSPLTDELAAFRRRVGQEQLLLASATTEKGIGGDVRSSSCHVALDGDRFVLRKDAPVISYGPWADAVLVTARRGPDSPPSDQVLVVCRSADVTLTRTSAWNAMGMRGTCSDGFLLEATSTSGHILPTPYGELSAAVMLPTSHLLWAAVWLGVGTAATERAGAFVRKAARSTPGTLPPSARPLAELVGVLQQMRDVLGAGLARYTRSETDGTDSLSFALAMNAVKTSSTTLVVDVVNRALLICGLAGYREDGPFRMSRLLRDAHAGAVMVSNERIYQNSAQMLLVSKEF